MSDKKRIEKLEERCKLYKSLASELSNTIQYREKGINVNSPIFDEIALNIERIGSELDKINTELQAIDSEPSPVESSEENDRDNYERFTKIIEDRISHFKEIYHSFEATALSNAFAIIKELVPPSNFAKYESQRVEREVTKGGNYTDDYGKYEIRDVSDSEIENGIAVLAKLHAIKSVGDWATGYITGAKWMRNEFKSK